MTAGFPHGTFSQAELAGDQVTTRCITRSVSAPGTTIRAMPGDLEPLPERLAGRARRGPGGVAARLLGRVRAELPVVGAGTARPTT